MKESLLTSFTPTFLNSLCICDVIMTSLTVEKGPKEIDYKRTSYWAVEVYFSLISKVEGNVLNSQSLPNTCKFKVTYS